LVIWWIAKLILKIAKRLSESVNRRSSDNTMAKWKRRNTDLQNISQKIEQHEPYYTRGGVNVYRWSGEVSNSCSTCGIRGVTHDTRWCRKDQIMVATVKLSKWWMQLNTCKVMLVSDIYQFAKKQHKCTLIILIKT
jgi:hypothetical protein